VKKGQVVQRFLAILILNATPSKPWHIRSIDISRIILSLLTNRTILRGGYPTVSKPGHLAIQSHLGRFPAG